MENCGRMMAGWREPLTLSSYSPFPTARAASAKMLPPPLRNMKNTLELISNHRSIWILA